MHGLHNPADVIFRQALVEKSPQPPADALDAEGEAVLVSCDLQVEEPRGAGKDVHPLAHEVHPVVHAGKPVQEDGDPGVRVEIEALDFQRGGARGDFQLTGGAEDLFRGDFTERLPVVSLETERAQAGTAQRDGEPGRRGLGAGQNGRPRLCRHRACRPCFLHIEPGEAASDPQSAHFRRNPGQPLSLRQPGVLRPSPDDSPDAPLAFAEEHRIRHAVACFGHQRVGRGGVGAAEDEGRPFLLAGAGPHRHAGTRKEERQVHLLEEPGIGNQDDVEVDQSALRLRSDDEGKTGPGECSGVGGARKEGHVDECAGQGGPRLAEEKEMGRRSLHVGERRKPQDKDAACRLLPRGIAEAGIGEVQPVVAKPMKQKGHLSESTADPAFE